MTFLKTFIFGFLLFTFSPICKAPNFNTYVEQRTEQTEEILNNETLGDIKSRQISALMNMLNWIEFFMRSEHFPDATKRANPNLHEIDTETGEIIAYNADHFRERKAFEAQRILSLMAEWDISREELLTGSWQYINFDAYVTAISQ
jgi:hypothetical protein